MCHDVLIGRQKKLCDSERCKAYKRPFRFWDGEGRTLPDGSHILILLANSDGEYLEDENGLSSVEIFEFLRYKRTAAFNVWFSFGYDVNKILEDVPIYNTDNRGSLEQLWKRTFTRWAGHWISYVPRKMFTVSKEGISYHSTDVYGFFQESFIKALKNSGIDVPLRILEGKAGRANFDEWKLEDIREYNFEELRLGLQLMNQLRDSLYITNLIPDSWHGPAAIAKKWLTNQKAQQYYAKAPDAMQDAIMRAYFGGRIDVSCIGEVDVHRHDLASAYPAGMTACLAQHNVTWRHHRNAKTTDPYALYHVEWSTSDSLHNPFPFRIPGGIILYPNRGRGWYHGVEVIAAERAYPGRITRLSAWYPYSDGERVFPFSTSIPEMYAQRRVFKRQKNHAEKSLKLCLNSLYGVTAQHEGMHGTPRWQNYLWAGFITAFTRARILDAMHEVGIDNLVAVMTDGIFTRARINGSYTKDQEIPLGTWEYEGRSTALIVSPGLYALFDEDGESKTYKTRGMPDKLNYGWILREWGCRTERDVYYRDDAGVLRKGIDAFGNTRPTFIGMGRALNTGGVCGIFIDEERKLSNVTIGGTTKRKPIDEWVGYDGWLEYPLQAREKEMALHDSEPYRYQPHLFLDRRD